MNAQKTPTVWGFHVGTRGDQLPVLTRTKGPFPPRPGAAGLVAIGWPAMGDMRMWADDYGTYFRKFPIAYPEGTARTDATAANMLWNFAFEMKQGDWVICPCSSEGVLLVGVIDGEYEADWGEIPGLRGDFIHFRTVRWHQVLHADDPRHAKLNRIGLLTLSRPKMTVSELEGILDEVELVDVELDD